MAGREPRGFSRHSKQRANLLRRGTASVTVGSSQGGGVMKLYRVNKLAKAGGLVIKRKHILAHSDKNAVDQAAQSPDCPICDVLRDGEKVGSIL